MLGTKNTNTQHPSPITHFNYFYGYTCLKIAKQLCTMRGPLPRPSRRLTSLGGASRIDHLFLGSGRSCRRQSSHFLGKPDRSRAALKMR